MWRKKREKELGNSNQNQKFSLNFLQVCSSKLISDRNGLECWGVQWKKEEEKEREQMQGDHPLEGKKREEENLWFPCLINWDVLL